MTCLVGHPSIEATPAGHTAETPSRTTTPRRRQTSHCDCDSLRITPVIKTTNHLPDDQPPTSTTDYYLARLPNGNPSTYPTIYPIWQPTGLFHDPFHCHSCTIQYSRWSESMQSSLATIDASILEVLSLVLRIVYSLFFAIYPKLLKLFYFVAFIPQE